MITASNEALVPDLPPRGQQTRAFVGYCDIVESVRLYEVYGPSLAKIWEAAIDEQFEDYADRSILKVEGDALIFSASSSSDAVDITIALSRALADARLDGIDVGIQLRSGLVEGPYWQGRHAAYGPAINIASRLADIALPGEILLTEAVRLGLPARFDMRLSDRGDCFLRNVSGAVRLHALESEITAQALPMLIPDTALKLRIAILAPKPVVPAHGAETVSEAFADAVSTDLSSVRGFGMISRLSTRRVSDEAASDPTVARELLGAHYVLSGRCLFEQDRFQGWLELSDTQSGDVIWSDKVNGAFKDLFRNGGLSAEISRHIMRAVMQGEKERTQAQPLQTIENYSLLLSGINLMHSLSEREFQRAYAMLETLAHRASRTSTPLAWMARWHNLRVLQRWSDDPKLDAQRAADLCRRALDTDPSNALAHAMLGMTHTHLEKRLDLAAESYETALAANQSEPLAWLMRGAMRSFTDDGQNALADVYQANALSPLDPQRYYFLTLTAGAHVTAGEDERALELVTRSLQFNRNHLSSWRVKAVAEWRTDRGDEARATVAEILKRDPGFTVSGYLAEAPSSDYRIGREIAKCLRDAGVPE